jgi:hypothetical protein
MAEYVRRKRPPADHPFWTHLNDRAHPPSVVWPVVLPTVVGLGLGLVAGFNDRLSFRQALQTAGVISATLAATLAVCCALPLLFNAILRPRSGDQWSQALAAFLGIGLAGFLMAFVPLTLFLIWYSVSGGHGPWVGMAIGAALGLGPGVLIAWVNRHRWADRRRRWPRWETMRRRHRRQTAPAQPVAPTTEQLGQTQAVGEETRARREQDQPGA